MKHKKVQRWTFCTATMCYKINILNPCEAKDSRCFFMERLQRKQTLAACYANTLKLAAENHCSSVAFPLISAGVFGCPSEIAIAVAIQAIRDFLVDHDMDIYLVVFEHKAFKISSSLFEKVQRFIDERYIEELLDEEYRGDMRERRTVFESAEEDKFLNIPQWIGKAKECSLEDLLDEIDDTFFEALLRLIDAKGKTDPEVYKRANVDRNLFWDVEVVA